MWFMVCHWPQSHQGDWGETAFGQVSMTYNSIIQQQNKSRRHLDFQTFATFVQTTVQTRSGCDQNYRSACLASLSSRACAFICCTSIVSGLRRRMYNSWLPMHSASIRLLIRRRSAKNMKSCTIHPRSINHGQDAQSKTQGGPRKFWTTFMSPYRRNRSRQTHTHTHSRWTALCPGLPRWAGTRKVKPIWILLKQEIVSGSGISWVVCKSALCSRQTTMPAPHHSVFYRPDALPAAQPTASKHWRLKHWKQDRDKIKQISPKCFSKL